MAKINPLKEILILDFLPIPGYNTPNFIGQFATILSVNKTREPDGHFMPIFCLWVRSAPIFLFFGGIPMTKRPRYLAHAAIIAALYAVLTHMQNLLLPNSASMMIQFRLSEALCVLAFFTPAAIPGLTVGCLLFNITSAGALPLDWLVGSLATLLAAAGMWASRRLTLGSLPLPGLLLPALTNAMLVGWELAVYIGGGFWLNAMYVAIGEAAVLLILGSALYYAIKLRRLDSQLFGEA